MSQAIKPHRVLASFASALMMVVSAVAGLGCPGSGHQPSPLPSPSPSGSPTNLPSARANATVQENLALITQVARNYRPGAYLVRIEGNLPLSGRIETERHNLNYVFDYANRTAETIDYWRVDSAGRVSYVNSLPFPRGSLDHDITPGIRLDSPAIIQSAVANGFNFCLDSQGPQEWRLQFSIYDSGPTPVAPMVLFGTLSSFGEILISPLDGRFLGGLVSSVCRPAAIVETED